MVSLEGEYKCKQCDFVTGNRHELATHYRFKHPKTSVVDTSASVVKGKVKVGEEREFSVSEIADALLKRVVSALSEFDNLQREVIELKSYREKCEELELGLSKALKETERVLKLHNDQIKSREFTSSEELKRLAKL